MSLNRFFEIGGLNLWLVAAGNGLNFVLEALVLFAAALLGAENAALAQALTVLGTFLGTLLVAFICGRMERERYLGYAGYTLPGNLLLTVPSILYSGLFGIMLVAVAVMGAFNGARLAEMSVPRHSRRGPSAD
jgi:hypothetical protein